MLASACLIQTCVKKGGLEKGVTSSDVEGVQERMIQRSVSSTAQIHLKALFQVLQH
jgi:hypothetical protein